MIVEFVTPMMFAASCSTPKSSLEHLDETSIYFRPLYNHKLMGFGQNGDAAVGRESRKQRSMEQQQRKLINDLARQNRRHRTLEANKRGSKTSQIGGQFIMGEMMGAWRHTFTNRLKLNCQNFLLIPHGELKENLR
jgi:hypothetical protein